MAGRVTIREAGQVGNMAGRVTIRKAGEVISTGSLRAGGGSQAPLKHPRAVTKEEAPFITPARESTKTTMMPWRGWIQRFIADTLGEDKLKKLRQTVFFIEDDLYELNAPNQSKKIPISRTDPTITAQYRHPAPGSQPAVRIPDMEETEDPYDSGYFKRDTRRRYQFSELENPENEKLKIEYMDPKDPAVAQAKQALMKARPASSPGNKVRWPCNANIAVVATSSTLHLCIGRTKLTFCFFSLFYHDRDDLPLDPVTLILLDCVLPCL